MVTTRRQSGVVSKAVGSQNLPDHTSDFKMDEPDDPSESSSEEEEERDYKSRKTRKKPTAGPRAKRQKLAKPAELEDGSAAVVAKVTKRRRGKDLSLLVTMPLDILFTILGLLLPKDLLSVSQTNKLFHQTLAAPNAKSVWIAARGPSGAPEPPRDVSEPRWASLLFRSTCQTCGAKGVMNVDFMLRRRACTHCKKNHLVVTSKFPKKFPHYDKEILQYVLHTNVGGWAHGHASCSEFYWDQDVETVWKKWSALKSAAHNGYVGAKDAFKAWREDRLKWVEENLDSAGALSCWHQGQSMQSAIENHNQAAENRVLRLAAVKQRFLDAGFLASDVNAALDLDTEGISSGVANVTNGVWVRLRPKLEPLVVEKREWRLDKELQDIVRPRMEALKGVYKGYLSGLRPSEKRASPAYQFLRAIPEIGALVDADRETEVTASDFQQLVTKLPDYAARYMESYKQALAATIPTSDYNEGMDPLELARFVFTCEATVPREILHGWGGGYTTTDKCSSSWMVGWPLISAHLHASCIGVRLYEKGIIFSSYASRTAKLSELASELAERLVTLAGLDPKTATIDDMDRNESFFVCMLCSNTKQWPILNWRQTHRHMSENHRHSFTSRTWMTRAERCRLATPEERDKAKAANCSLEKRPVWCCDRCPSAAPFQSQKAMVTDHLRTAHSITTPDTTKDCFIDEPGRWTIPAYNFDTRPPAPHTARQGTSSSTANYQCLQCTEPSTMKRRFIEIGVIAHIKAKHEISNPQNDLHYKADPAISVPKVA